VPSIPHRFRDPALLALALTHSSTGEERDNERLEFLGDAALDLVVAEELFLHHTDLPEGELTVLKAWVVSRRTLAEAGRALGLEEGARLGGGLSRRTLSRAVLANLYEAVLGAIYLDGGLEAARSFIRATLAEPLQLVRERRSGANPKQLLQEYCQRRSGSPPQYEVLDDRGRAHARAFLVRARTGETTFPSAWGRTRKEAEHWAAYEALLVLEEGEPA
jgi:ribonuclease-3